MALGSRSFKLLNAGCIDMWDRLPLDNGIEKGYKAKYEGQRHKRRKQQYRIKVFLKRKTFTQHCSGNGNHQQYARIQQASQE